MVEALGLCQRGKIMTQHTPGPWQTFPALSNPPSIVIGPVERGDLGFVAQTVGGNDEANARLIAAAPKLLGALKYLNNTAGGINSRQHAGFDIGPGEWSDLYDASARAQAAIAKAQG